MLFIHFTDLQDDIQNSMRKQSSILNFENLMTVYSHHKKVTCVILLHYLFQKNMRKISLNCHNLVFTNSPRDFSVITHLATQAFPGTKAYLSEAFQNALTQQQFGYMVVSSKPGRSAILRVATNIFSKQKHPLIYLPNKGERAFKIMRLISENEYSRLLEGSRTTTQQNTPAIITVNNRSTCNPTLEKNVPYGSTRVQVPVDGTNITKTENNTRIYEASKEKTTPNHKMSHNESVSPTVEANHSQPAHSAEEDGNRPMIENAPPRRADGAFKIPSRKKLFAPDRRKKAGCHSCDTMETDDKQSMITPTPKAAITQKVSHGPAVIHNDDVIMKQVGDNKQKQKKHINITD